jgi:torulene dioxygenase
MGEKKEFIFFGYCPRFSFLDWLLRFIIRIDQLIIRPIVPSQQAPDFQAVGVTATPNYPIPSHYRTTGKNERILVSKTDANTLQKINPETLGNSDVY